MTTRQVPGFQHLAGKDVRVILAGSLYGGGDEQDDIPHESEGDQTVNQSGEIAVPALFYGDITVGLLYTLRAKTLPISYEAAAAGKGAVKNINKVYVRASGEGVLEAAPGNNESRSVPMQMALPDVGEYQPMQEVPLMGDWDTDAMLVLEHSAPGPCVIHAMVLEVATGG